MHDFLKTCTFTGRVPQEKSFSGQLKNTLESWRLFKFIQICNTVGVPKAKYVRNDMDLLKFKLHESKREETA